MYAMIAPLVVRLRVKEDGERINKGCGSQEEFSLRIWQSFNALKLIVPPQVHKRLNMKSL